MSASFPLRASKSDDLFFKKIVIASNLLVNDNFKYSAVIPSDRRECGNLFEENAFLLMRLLHSVRNDIIKTLPND
jgi:hypothetical protein